MSRRANPAVVGGFVLGALALVVAGVVYFGGAALFRERPQAVAYFDGSVNGLTVGAPVTWRGVRIGSVTGVRVDVDETSHVARIPVFMEFDPHKVHFVAGAHDLHIRDAVKAGMRAQLKLQSLVTGQLYVELEMHPETPIKLVGPNLTLVPEIPTIRSGFDVLAEALERLPLQQLGQTAIHALSSVDQLASGPELKELLVNLAASAQELSAFLKDVHSEVAPMANSVASASDAARETFKGAEALEDDARKALAGMQKTTDIADDQIVQVSIALRAALRDADQSLKDSQVALASMNSMISPNSPQRADINQIMRNLAIATQSLRSFADQLDRNPNALLLGRK